MDRQAGRRATRRIAALVVLCASAVPAGCGGAAPPSSAPASTAVATRPAAPAPASAERDARAAHAHRLLLRRHDVPPRGVRAQIDYYQEGGPYDCVTEPSARHPMTFGHGLLRPATNVDFSPESSTRAEVGEPVTVCLAVADGAAPIVFAMRAPDGAVVRRARMPDGLGTWYTDIPDRAPLGRYAVIARQGSRRVRGTFTVGAPQVPEYHVVPRGIHPRIMDIVLLGLRPHERAVLHFYRPLPYPGSGMPQAVYATSTQVRAAADGVVRFPVAVGPVGTVGAHCTGFVVKALVRGRLLDDLHNTLSGLTVCRAR